MPWTVAAVGGEEKHQGLDDAECVYFLLEELKGRAIGQTRIDLPLRPEKEASSEA